MVVMPINTREISQDLGSNFEWRDLVKKGDSESYIINEIPKKTSRTLKSVF